MTKGKLYADTNGDGIKDDPSTPTAIVDGSDIKNLWEAGLILWNTNADARTIYANVTGSSAMTPFTTANLTPRSRAC